MMKIISVDDVCQLVSQVSLPTFFKLTIDALEGDFLRWQQLTLTPRLATHYPFGVLELMPCADDKFYTCKYINGHPDNPKHGKLCVTGVGLLVDVKTGYPLMLCEMTLLTAIRTAATAALAAKYLARKESSSMAMIGTGAQAEFLVAAMAQVFQIRRIAYYDIDSHAMQKFRNNLKQDFPEIEIVGCSSAREAIQNVDILITATAAKKKNKIFTKADLYPGLHIHAMGGDCPGKTEFDPAALAHCKVVVEQLEQCREEGEIQNTENTEVYAELWEIISGLKPGRKSAQEITFFDSVGFALEDFSIIKLLYGIVNQHSMGQDMAMTPSLADPKNLYGLVKGSHK